MASNNLIIRDIEGLEKHIMMLSESALLRKWQLEKRDSELRTDPVTGENLHFNGWVGEGPLSVQTWLNVTTGKVYPYEETARRVEQCWWLKRQGDTLGYRTTRIDLGVELGKALEAFWPKDAHGWLKSTGYTMPGMAKKLGLKNIDKRVQARLETQRATDAKNARNNRRGYAVGQLTAVLDLLAKYQDVLPTPETEMLRQHMMQVIDLTDKEREA